MSATQKFQYLNHSKLARDYETEIILHGQKVIPSDTFWLEKNEFVVLDLPKKINQIYIKILGIKGSNLGEVYLIPENAFENLTSSTLTSYRHF